GPPATWASRRAAHALPARWRGAGRGGCAVPRAGAQGRAVLLRGERLGALDALTRLQVRADVERLWLSERQTVLFITHSIEEAVGLSDRVVVMSPSPGRIVREVAIELPRPRPLALGEAPALADPGQAIYGRAEEMGVVQGTGAAPRGELG